MTDHHDYHDDYGDHHDQVPYDEPEHAYPAADDEPDPWLEHHLHDTADEHADQPDVERHADRLDLDQAAVEHHTDPPALDQNDAAPDDITDVFPPPVDVGALPEPVDGFPWIDTGSLGTVDAAAAPSDTSTPVDPHELAEYAGTEIPPGADPWAALADSDDPAASTLARWWRED